MVSEKKSNHVICNNICEIIIFLMCFSIFLWYSIYDSWNFPAETFFEQFYIADKYFNHTLQFGDLLSRYCEHGMLGANLVFLFNVAVFHFNTWFDILFDCALILAGGIIVIWEYKKYIPKDKNKVLYYCGYILTGIVSFGLLQSTFAGGMNVQVRMGLLWCIIAFAYYDYALTKEIDCKYLIGATVITIFEINICGTLYSFAGILSLFVSFIYSAHKHKRVTKKQGVIVAINFASVLGYFVEYFFSGGGASSTNGAIIANAIENLVYRIGHIGETIKEILAYNGASVLGSALYQDGKLSVDTYALIGVAVTVVIVYAIVLYFRKKIYEKTYWPLMLIGYSFWVVIEVLLGRYVQYGWTVSNWYGIHRKLQIIGVIWIFSYDWIYSDGTGRHKAKRIINSIIVGTLAIVLLYGNHTHYIRAPYEKVWWDNKKVYLYVDKAENMPVDENTGYTPLLNSVDLTMQAINIMQENELNVYYGIGHDLKSSRLAYGIDDSDYRLDTIGKLYIKTQNQGKVEIKMKIPQEIQSEVKIYVNEELTDYQNEIGECYVVETPKNEMVSITIECPENENISLVSVDAL